jgi:tetratricopeptide (TPR) repeat protein
MNTGEQAELTRRDALQRLVMFPFLLSISEHSQRSLEGDLRLYAAAITACSYLRNGGLEDMKTAFHALSSYIPVLKTIVKDSSPHRKTAATLLSQALKMKSRMAYHFEGIKQALHYAEEAVTYARASQNKIALILALRELTAAYGWIKGPQRLQGLSFAEEANSLMQLKLQQKQEIHPAIQSLVYTGLAKQQALNGKQQETLASLGKAREHFPDTPSIHGQDGTGYNRMGLLRDSGLAYAYLGQYEGAFKVYGEIIDLDGGKLTSKLPMVARNRLEVLSVTTTASLKLPANQKDKDRSIALWKATVTAAQELESETYLNRVHLAYETMEGIWSDDADVRDLRDLLVH